MGLIRPLSLLSVMLPLALNAAEPAGNGRNITKCKDKQGVWHYGDYASEACAKDSDVTEINQHGVRVKTEEATRDLRDSATLSEISKRKAELERLKAEERERDDRLLSMYESVNDIESTRDVRLDYISDIIKTDQEFLGQLHQQLSALTQQNLTNPSDRLKEDIRSTEANIDLFERVIADRLRQRNELAEQFDADIERYRALLLLREAEEKAQAGY